MMVYDDLQDGRSLRADDDLLVRVNETDDHVRVIRVRGPQKEQTVLKTFTGPAAMAQARQLQQALMIRSR